MTPLLGMRQGGVAEDGGEVGLAEDKGIWTQRWWSWNSPSLEGFCHQVRMGQHSRKALIS